MKSITLLIVFVILLSTIASAKEIISKETIKSQYGTLGDWIGFGQKLIKITYSDNTIEYQVGHGSLLKPGQITSIDSNINVYVNQNPPSMKFTVKGTISPSMGAGDPADYKYILYRILPTGDEYRQTYTATLAYGESRDASFSGNPIATIGTQNYYLQEYVSMLAGSTYSWVKADKSYVTVIVTDPNAVTGTPTPPPQYQCSNGQWVTDTSLCPTSTPTPTPTPSASPTPSSTATTSPTATSTSGMTLETPTATRTPSATQTPYDTPGFDSIFAIIGLVITAYMVLRQRPPKDEV